jgi:hypothetical protein
VKLDTSLVGDNNKETAPTLFIYIRLLLITPTRAVHVYIFYLMKYFFRLQAAVPGGLGALPERSGGKHRSEAEPRGDG